MTILKIAIIVLIVTAFAHGFIVRKKNAVYTAITVIYP